MSEAYKIVRPAEWDEWQASPEPGWLGSADDRRDGYIHLSTVEQVEGTLRRYFSTDPEVYVVSVALEGLPVRFEPARDGTLFPHVYGPLPASAAGEREVVTAGSRSPAAPG